jgi:hypothetical protein
MILMFIAKKLSQLLSTLVNVGAVVVALVEVVEVVVVGAVVVVVVAVEEHNIVYQ